MIISLHKTQWFYIELHEYILRPTLFGAPAVVWPGGYILRTSHCPPTSSRSRVSRHRGRGGERGRLVCRQAPSRSRGYDQLPSHAYRLSPCHVTDNQCSVNFFSESLYIGSTEQNTKHCCSITLVWVSHKIRSQDNVEEEAVVSDLPECREEFPGRVTAPHREHVVLDRFGHVWSWKFEVDFKLSLADPLGISPDISLLPPRAPPVLAQTAFSRTFR